MVNSVNEDEEKTSSLVKNVFPEKFSGPQPRRKKSPSPAHMPFLKSTYPTLLILLDGLESKIRK